MIRFDTSDQPIDVSALRAELHNPRHGGFCAFEGWVRNSNEGRPVGALEYEIFEELARSEGDRILLEAQDRFGDIDAIGVHRSGMLEIGALAVWVGVSSAHRDEAFRACRYVIDQIKHRLPVWKKEHYLSGDTQWVACAHPSAEDEAHAHHGHMHHPSQPAAPFVPDYSRQMRLPQVGESGQARLEAAGVLVIGAGGLGSPVLSYLAGAGIGRIGIVDPDRVEASNLHRQFLYRAADLGRGKAECAAERVRAVNPRLAVETFEHVLRADTVTDAFRRYDLVIDCSDDMQSRFLCSDAAVLTGTTLILASVHQHEGQLQVIRGGSAPCLRCLWPVPPAPDAAGSCADDGVLGPVPGVLGAMQCNEALKLLLGLPSTPDGSLLLVDLLDNTTQKLAIDPRAGCATRGGCVAVAREALDHIMTEIDLRFDSLAAAEAEGFHIVDLREAVERASQPMPVAAQWLPFTALAERIDELPRDKTLLLVCAAGRRSVHAARQLRQAGLDGVFSLSGGLHALG